MFIMELASPFSGPEQAGVTTGVGANVNTCTTWSQHVFGLSGHMCTGWWILGTYLKEP